MNLFIKKVSFALLSVMIFYAAIATLFADGKTDPFYLRFTSGLQHSLVLGTSRAAQGIMPQEFYTLMKRNNIELPLYNFSFTISMSPYGSIYLNAIKNKIDPKTKNGLFILAVDPWALARLKTNTFDDPSLFREQKQALAHMLFFNLPVNLEYLIKNYPKSWNNLIDSHYHDSKMILRKNGWLDLTVELDSLAIIENTYKKIEYYKLNYLPKYTFSPRRYEYLIKTIHYLQPHGKIVLVRIPISKEMIEIENKLMPNFDNLIHQIAKEENIPYFNYINNFKEYKTIDGNHLYKESRKKFSKNLSEKIRTRLFEGE